MGPKKLKTAGSSSADAGKKRDKAAAKRAKEQAARREAAGFTADQGDTVLQGPTVELEIYRPQTKIRLANLFAFFAVFFTSVASVHKLHIFPNTPKTPADVFSADGGFTYDSLLAFVVFLATNSIGRITELPTVNSLLLHLDAITQLYRWKSGNSIPTKVIHQVRYAIRLILPKQLPIRHIARVRYYPDFKTVRMVAYATLSPLYAPHLLRTRFQILLLMAILLQNGLRIGSVLPSGQKGVREHEQGWTWGGGHLTIFKGGPGRKNRITASFLTVNGKTAESRNLLVVLEPCDVPCLDPVLWLLTLAAHIGALPVGHTISSLLSPSLFDSAHVGDYITLDFAPSFAHLPIFARSRDLAETWTTNLARFHLQQVSDLVPLPIYLSPHSLRRMNAQGKKDEGLEQEQRQLMLTHIWSSSVLVYAEIFGYDPGAAIFGHQASTLPSELHPNRLPNVDLPAGKSEWLSEQDRLALWMREDVQDMMEKLEEYEDGPSPIQAEIDKQRNAISAYVRVLAKRTRRRLQEQAAGVNMGAFDGFADVKSRWTRKLEEEEEEEEEDDEEEDEVMDEALDQQDEDDAEGEDGLAPAEIIKKLEDAQDIVEPPASNVIVYPLDWPEGWVLDPALADPLPIAGPSNAAQSSLPTQTTSAHLTTSASTSASTSTLPTTTSAPQTTTSGPRIIVPSTSPPPALKMMEKVPWWRDICHKVFNGEGSAEDIITAFASLPASNTEVFAYPPSLRPVNGRCPIRGCDLSEVKQRDGEYDALIAHITSCAEGQAVEKLDESTLTYPATILWDPILRCPAGLASQDNRRKTGCDPSEAKDNLEPASLTLLEDAPGRKSYSVFKWSQTLNALFSPHLAMSFSPYPRCRTCSIDLYSLSFAKAHVCGSHGLYAPPVGSGSMKPLALLPWNKVNMKLPEPFYRYWDDMVHLEPREIETSSARFHQQRISQPVTPGRPLLPNPSITIALPPVFNGFADTRCSFESIASTGLVAEGLCIFCVHDPHLSMGKRMSVFRSSWSQRKHTQTCLKEHLADWYGMQILPAAFPLQRFSYLIHGTQLHCPASDTCPHLAFDNALELVQHVVLYHNVTIHNSETQGKQKLGVSKSLADATFEDEAKLKAWLDLKDDRYDKVLAKLQPKEKKSRKGQGKGIPKKRKSKGKKEDSEESEDPEDAEE